MAKKINPQQELSKALKQMNEAFKKAKDYIKKGEYDLATAAFKKAEALGEDKRLREFHDLSFGDTIWPAIQKLYSQIQKEFDLLKVFHKENTELTSLRNDIDEWKRLYALNNTQSMLEPEALRNAEAVLKNLENTSKYIKEAESKAGDIYKVSLQQTKDILINEIEVFKGKIEGDISVLTAYIQFVDMLKSSQSEKLDNQKALEIVNSGRECLQKFETIKREHPTIDTRPYEEKMKYATTLLTTQFKKDLEEKNIMFKAALGVLLKQIIILEKKPFITLKYKNVSKNAKAMHVELTGYGNRFFGQDTTLDNFEKEYKDFKKKCEDCIDKYSKQGKFQEHRIMSQTTAMILNAILGFFSLGAAPILSSIIHRELRWGFFNTGKTATHKAVDEVRDKLDQIKPS